jgi:hypothetical protein
MEQICGNATSVLTLLSWQLDMRSQFLDDESENIES